MNYINERELPIQEEVDLDLVDEHLREKVREIYERYDNFDQHMPEGWTEGMSIPDGLKTDKKRISNSSKQGISMVTRKISAETDESSDEESIPEGWKVPEENISEGWNPEEVEDGTSKVEDKLDNLRMKWAGSNYEIVLEKIEMKESWKTDKECSVRLDARKQQVYNDGRG